MREFCTSGSVGAAGGQPPAATRANDSLVVCASAIQASEPARTVTVAPGARYQAGWLYSLFLGEHWREAWTTPIEVPLLDLEKFDGGLRPDRLGGGLETKNLHFKSVNGRTWAFRSVDKDPTRVLDPDTRQSLIGDLYQDETSTAQPYGALIVPTLLDDAEVLHATPQLAVLPDDPRLGMFHRPWVTSRGRSTGMSPSAALNALCRKPRKLFRLLGLSSCFLLWSNVSMSPFVSR